MRTITDAIDGVQAMAVDALGVLYVANWPLFPSQPGWISVYEPGNPMAEYQITEGIDMPVALTLDRDGNAYVANLSPDPAFIRVLRAACERTAAID